MKTVAVVEDYEDNRIVLREMLSDLYAVTTYNCGKDALEGLRQSPPDAVILDIGLPDIDGDEVLRQMRKDPRLAGIPVVALTAHAMTHESKKYLQLNFDAFLTKPIMDDEVLLRAVAEVIDKSRDSDSDSRMHGK